MDSMLRVVSQNESETRGLAGMVARVLAKASRGKSATVFGLVGELGAGKTTFVRGFTAAWGSKSRVRSPTFLIMRRLGGRTRTLWHIDCYRVGVKDLRALGVKELFADPRNVILIEWAERAKSLLPKGTMWIRFRHGHTLRERIISFVKR